MNKIDNNRLNQWHNIAKEQRREKGDIFLIICNGCKKEIKGEHCIINDKAYCCFECYKNSVI